MSQIIKELDGLLRSKDIIASYKKTNSYKLDYNKEYMFFREMIMKNKLLTLCTVPSLLTAFRNTALTGLTLNPLLKQAYVKAVRVQGTYRAYLEPTYQGMITKMIETGTCTDVYAMVHYENDEIDIDFATRQVNKHVPYFILGKESGREIGAYAVAILPDKSKKMEYLTIDKINEIALLSDSYQRDKRDKTRYSAWSNIFRPDMIRKTAVKTLWNYMPKTNTAAIVFSSIIDADNQAQQYNLDKKVETPKGTITLKQTVTTKRSKDIM